MSVAAGWRGLVVPALLGGLFGAAAPDIAAAAAAQLPAPTTFAAEAEREAPSAEWCKTSTSVASSAGRRLVCADIAALDQILVYNRFGSFNPFGMIFALTRDVVSSVDGSKTRKAGEVRLADGKRPRPLTLRANAGDVLLLRVRNLLRDKQPGLSESFCRNGGWEDDKQRVAVRKAVSEGPEKDHTVVDHGEALCKSGSAAEKSVDAEKNDLDWPRTRDLAFSIDGLVAVAGRENGVGEETGAALRMCRGLASIKPGSFVECQFEVDREGTYFLASDASPAGGEGDGGSITHGLFGAVVAEQRYTRWYRSQVTEADFDTAWPKAAAEAGLPRHARVGGIDYETTKDEKTVDGVVTPGVPYLNIARPVDGKATQADFAKATKIEIVHSDLNAIIFRPAGEYSLDPDPSNPNKYPKNLSDSGRGACAAGNAPESQWEFCEVKFREFSVFFHDELKAFYTRNFDELGKFGQLAGVRDGFGINYGASGMGAALLANRKNIGPAADCAECLYEEFFLASWANGDPALLENFADDPSNVHHSYLNDPVTYRNFHAGPKETHVFHLHAHQWFAGNDPGRGSYLDSQTVAPRQGFSYDIYHGGLNPHAPGKDPSGKGWWETMGSGNRNRTIGDSIFHCHLYPHFAQGMWELWRVHDVLEDGTRRLPDGQETPGLSLGERSLMGIKRRPGSVQPWTGAWVEQEAGKENLVGTPIPALVPLPNHPLPLLPTYEGAPTTLAAAQSAKPPKPDKEQPVVRAMPGYPFTIAGRPGHRPPQAPMDIARKRVGDPSDKSKQNPPELDDPANDVLTNEYLDAGLPRHVVQDGATRKFGIGELPAELKQAGGLPLPNPAEATPAWESDQRKRELGWSQVVAKMLALGDMTAHLEKATFELLPYEGTPLERAAMGFHFDGKVWNDGAKLTLRKADGEETKPETAPGDDLTEKTGNVPSPERKIDIAQGAYKTLVSPPLGSNFVPADRFTVNGAPPKPGAPFADPCGGVAGGVKADGVVVARGEDPLLAGAPYAKDQTDFPRDRLLSGFRRFEASAVQLDLVTNRAGWHDPQARIAVLTKDSDRFKDGKTQSFPYAKLSPLISAREEPFFFRALSGECIEFRHTNELPKETELDDFQVKTPTDTIGQHIHLVKFDVTSSDGSGNGFNYEDGTFAPDEVASRLCAAEKGGATLDAGRKPGDLALAAPKDFCRDERTEHHSWWRAKRSANADRFQTTVQRWYADPILSNDGNSADGKGQLVDRTMRTVFSHDHFGPSSIQQHGYYTALVIEPAGSKWMTPDGKDESRPRLPRLPDEPGKADKYSGDTSLFNGRNEDVGTRKRVVNAFDKTHPEYKALVAAGYDDRTHPDFREFAIAIADFATLYDPRDRKSKKDVFPGPDPISDRPAYEDRYQRDGRRVSEAGMATLACELTFREKPADSKRFCGSAMKEEGRPGSADWFADENVSPAWHAAGRKDDSHSGAYLKSLLASGDSGPTMKMADHLLRYRLAAAGHDPLSTPGGDERKYASPVAPPERPESISVDHHDPYLVNYRGEPIPLRVGTKDSRKGKPDDCSLKPLAQQHLLPWRAGENEVKPPPPGSAPIEAFTKAEDIAAFKDCSIEYQRTDNRGDMAGVFSSLLHFDPATPILETYSGERNIIRLIQGAQEVQHTFNLEGVVWRRNIDQSFPAMGRQLDSIWRGNWPLGVKSWSTLHQRCQEFGAARLGRPKEYAQWSKNGWQSFRDNSPEQTFWRDYTHRIAECDNQEGVVTAQEIGISEHFEFGGAARGGYNGGYLSDKSRAAGQTRLEITEGQASSPSGQLASGDYIYDFGSHDALWNGAWGLLRVYGKNDSDTIPDLEKRAEDTTACILQRDISGAALSYNNECLQKDLQENQQTKLLKSRLAALPSKEDSVPDGKGSTDQKGNEDKTIASAKAVFCPANARHVYSLAVARDDTGRRYSRDLKDKDGLQFTLVNPAKVFKSKETLANFMVKFAEASAVGQTAAGTDDDRGVRPLGAPLELPAAADKPFVLRVRAGDCVHLAIVNALKKTDGGDFLADALGDARMPPITPLNVDPAWDDKSRENCRAGDALCLNQPVRWEADLSKPEIKSHKRLLRPSANLSVRVPIMTLTPNEKLSLPFGAEMNPPLPPQDESALAKKSGPDAEFVTFYAGRGALPELSRDEAEEVATMLIANALPGGIPQGFAVVSTSSQGLADVGGFRFSLAPEALSRQASRDQVLVDVLSAPDAVLSKIDRQKISANVLKRSAVEDTPSLKEKPAGQSQQELAIEAFIQKQGATNDDVRGVLAESDPAMSVRISKQKSSDDVSYLRNLLVQIDRKKTIEDQYTANPLVNTSKLGCELLGGRDRDGREDVDQVATCIPYAFGALPIKSFGDVIGHGAHGLLGALVVEPSNWHAQSGDHAFDLVDNVRNGATAQAIETRRKAWFDAAMAAANKIDDGAARAKAQADVQERASSEFQSAARAEIGAAPVLLAPGEAEFSVKHSGHLPGTSFSAVFEGGTHRVREHVVFWRDGMNLWDRKSRDRWVSSNGSYLAGSPSKMHDVPFSGPVADCHICTDSYDHGDKGVNYQSAPFNIRLRGQGQRMKGALESHYDLNAFEFPSGFYLSRNAALGSGTDEEEGVGKRPAMPILRAEAGEEVVIRVLHPSGRARQRAFVTTALDYDDLFPGFGFPHSALLAPGKGITASIARPVREGCYLWQDGPAQLRAGGTWGLLDVVAPGKIKDGQVSHCRRASSK